jgi:hypothetical protein
LGEACPPKKSFASIFSLVEQLFNYSLVEQLFNYGAVKVNYWSSVHFFIFVFREHIMADALIM